MLAYRKLLPLCCILSFCWAGASLQPHVGENLCFELLLIHKTEALSVWNEVMELVQLVFELPDDDAGWQDFEAGS